MGSKSPLAIDIQVRSLVHGQRLALGMSQSALAEKLGIAFQQVTLRLILMEWIPVMAKEGAFFRAENGDDAVGPMRAARDGALSCLVQ
jgi:hypothetical protein